MRLILILLLAAGTALAQPDPGAEAAAPGAENAPPEELPTIEEAVTGAVHHAGFMDVYFDPKKGRVLLEVAQTESDLLYLVSLPTGVGSNDIGLDRGQLGETRLVFFRRSGPKVLLVQRNLKFRAESDNPGEKRAVEEAFAISVLAGLDVVAESGGRVLVDATPLVVSDAYGIAQRLTDRGEGTYQLDAGRSAPDPDGLKGFPRNSVLEAWITLAGDKPGEQLRSVVPTAEYLTVRIRHQFIELPPPGFERRAYHPRSGYFSVTYRDYAAGLDEKVDRHLLVRHRLEKKNPEAERSEAVEPLVYYVDSGAPEPVRSALIEGAAWWNTAFEAAGFDNAFQVRLLPADVDPLDLRYNVIQWVHRETRGWSYGWGVIDPRTGEIIKGHVSLGSLRVRQDMLIAEGLTAPFGGESGSQAAQEMALARLRQLSAHEVGHTLGLAHNFAASSVGDKSVMDYPHPAVALDERGRVTLANAYSTEVSEWDRLAIEFGYRQHPSQQAALQFNQRLLGLAEAQGLRFISDPDVRGAQAAHAGAHLWDNGRDPLQRFTELMAVRRTALQRFSGAVLREGRPWGDLERALVPVYLLHRYQAEAAAKLIGGVDYDYGLRGQDDGEVEEIASDRQQAALAALLDSLSLSELALDSDLLRHLQPPAYGDQRDREFFSHSTANQFDRYAPARAATQLVTGLLLNPARVQRVAQQAARPNLAQLLDRYVENLLLSLNGDDDLLRAEVAWVALHELQRLAVSEQASGPVRAAALGALEQARSGLKRGEAARRMAEEIRRFVEDPDAESLPARVKVPPGSPI